MVEKQPSQWVGWVYFASAMLLVAGGIRIVAGLTGIFNANFYAVSQSGELIALNYTTLGWIYLLIGIVLVVTSLGLARGKLWAQIVAPSIITLSIITNLAFIGVYPFWAIVSLVIEGLIMYAITIHGDEVRSVGAVSKKGEKHGSKRR